MTPLVFPSSPTAQPCWASTKSTAHNIDSGPAGAVDRQVTPPSWVTRTEPPADETYPSVAVGKSTPVSSSPAGTDCCTQCEPPSVVATTVPRAPTAQAWDRSAALTDVNCSDVGATWRT